MLASVAASAQNTVMTEMKNADNAKTYSGVVEQLGRNVLFSLPQLKVTAIVPTDNAMSTYEMPASYVQNNRLGYIIDNLTIKSGLEQGKKYYKTKGNSYIRIEQNGGGYVAYNSADSKGVSLQAKETDNGTVLYADELIGPIMKSVVSTLDEIESFSEFTKVIAASGFHTLFDPVSKYYSADSKGCMMAARGRGGIGAEDTESMYKLLYIVDDYNYTLYVPTNEAMKQAYAAGLPTPEMYYKALEEDLDAGIEPYYDSNSKAAMIQEVLRNFVKYHLQDNAIFVDKGFESGSYKTAKYKLVQASTAGKYKIGTPYALKVEVSPSAMTVTDAMGNTRKVLSDDKLRNIMANDIWYDTNPSNGLKNAKIVKSGFVAIQGIDGPLYYDTSEQFEYKYYPTVTE